MARQATREGNRSAAGDSVHLAAIVERLLRCRRLSERLVTTDAEWQIGSEEEARRIQDLLAEATGETVVGWKLGALDQSAQRRLDLSKPFVGRVFESRLWNSPAVLDGLLPVGCKVEVEIAMRLERNFPRGDRAFCPADVASAVSAYHVALEIIDLVWQRPGGPGGFDILADNGGCFGLVVGPAVTAFESKGRSVQLRVDGNMVAETKIENDIASLLERVAWLANHLNERGFCLKAGQFVATGTWTGMTPLRLGQTAMASIESLGTMEMKLG